MIYTDSSLRGGLRPTGPPVPPGSFVATPVSMDIDLTDEKGFGVAGGYYPGSAGIPPGYFPPGYAPGYFPSGYGEPQSSSRRRRRRMSSVREEDEGAGLTTDMDSHGRRSRSSHGRHSSHHSSSTSTSSRSGSHSSSSSSTSSDTEVEQIVTPKATPKVDVIVNPPTPSSAAPPLATAPSGPPLPVPPPALPPPTIPGTPGTEYWGPRVLGDQQNEMSRYLHHMSDQFNDRQNTMAGELREILESINDLRSHVHREHVMGHVLPDGRVQLRTGEIVEGIRGVPPAVPIEPHPAGGHVPGKILADGTVLAGDKIVDGVTAEPFHSHATETDLRELAQRAKDKQQDDKLAGLQDIGEYRMKQG